MTGGGRVGTRHISGERPGQSLIELRGMIMPEDTGKRGTPGRADGGPARISFGREICGSLDVVEQREWLTTNGTGSYASGTVAGMLTRVYHGLLVAATKPPVGRTLMLVKADATVAYRQVSYDLFTN